MRTLKEIREAIEASWVSDPTLAEMYGLDPSKTFAEQYSKVSLESVLVGIFALASYTLERIVGDAQEEIGTLVDSRIPSSIPWYADQVLAYQDGYPLEWLEGQRRYGYSTLDPAARIVKHVAVREVLLQSGRMELQVLVSKDGKEPLEEEELDRLGVYLYKIAAPGTSLDLVSKESDRLKIKAQVNYDPLVLTSQGRKISDGTDPVAAAVQKYIDNIKYGGVFNKTRLVDAIQGAEGVVDVILTSVQTFSEGTYVYMPLAGNNYTSTSGSFIVEDLDISYLAQNEG